MRAAGCRTAARLLLLGATLSGATGCRHKATVAVVPIPPPQQLPVNTTAEIEPPQPVVEKVPLQPTPLATVTVPAKKKKVRKPRRVAAAVSPATPGTTVPLQTASTGSPGEPSSIGALTPGGSEEPQLRKQATELIGTLEKRLASLSSDTKKREKDAIFRVMNFERQAQTALEAGDSEGAVTLATKAKLLLDDLLKQEAR